jgi:hypothetical protein
MHDDLSAGRAGWLVSDLLGRLSCGNGKRGPSGPLFLCCIYDEVGVVGETKRRGVIVYSAELHIAGAGAEPEARAVRQGTCCGNRAMAGTSLTTALPGVAVPAKRLWIER